MSTQTRQLIGRILLSENDQPIHGLLVKAWMIFGTEWNSGSQCKYPLGCDLTDQNGIYRLGFDESMFSEDCKCKGHLEIRLKIYDRDGHEIHQTHKKIEDCPPDGAFRVDLFLDRMALEEHLSRPLSWDCPDEPLVPGTVMDEIEEAAEVLASRDGAGPHSALNALLCAKPSLTLFDNILQDACKTLDGDLRAADRYRDVLDAICACRTDSCCADEGAYAVVIDAILDEECDADPCKPVKLENKSPCCDDQGACPEPASLVSGDKASILVMAAFHIACGHKDTARAYVLAIVDQLCRLQFLGALHRAAVDTLCEVPHSEAHFRDLLAFLGSKCTSAAHNYPYVTTTSSLPCCENCLDPALEYCIRDAYRNWCAVTCYKITKVNPSRACPGDKIIICGCGFGDIPGRVRFIEQGGMQPGPLVEAESWCNNRICVVVPEGAGCGLMLELPLDTFNVCGRYLDYRRTGTIVNGFEGTHAQILKFLVKNHFDNECLLPGEILKIRWKTCAADRVVIRIVETDSGAVVAVLDPAPARGAWDFANTDFTVTTRLRVEIIVHGKCRPLTSSRQLTFVFQKPPNLSIDGIEVTQAIQYYRASQHLTDPADRGPDNSLQLVANKSAWVRVFLRSGQDPAFDFGQLSNVSGTLVVERRVNGIWSVVANLAPVNAPVTAQDSFASYDAERRDIDATLNFVVLASTMTGLLRLSISVSSADDCYGGVATSSHQVDVNLQQELQIAAVSVGYDGPPIGAGADVTFPAPTAAQIATEAGFSLRIYPVQNTPNIRIIDTQDATLPLDDNNIPAGGCDDNWGGILDLVAEARTNDGNQAGWFYYGFVTSSIPRSHGNVGCASGGNGAGLLGSGTTLAHEIGHQAGLAHAPCGAVGTPEAAFPLYEPYDTGITSVNSGGNTVWQDASIGEYGLDINDGTIYNPNPTSFNNGKDLMSYCGNRWVALYTHTYMVNNADLNPVALTTGVSGEAHTVGQTQEGDAVKPFITLLGRVFKDDKIDVRRVARVPTREPRMRGQRTELTVELIGNDGEVVTSAPVFTMPAHEGNCGHDNDCCGDGRDLAKPPFAFIAAMPDVTEGSAIQIRAGEEKIVWKRERPRTCPAISSVSVIIRKDKLDVSWQFDKKTTERLDVWLRWSEDGKYWHGLAVGLSGNSATIDPARIPARRVSIQVIAHDGFSSVKGESDPVDLPPVVANLAIVHPEDKQRFRTGGPLHLWGVVTGREAAKDPGWYIDGKKVSAALDAWITLPKVGKHKVELRAKGAATESVQIVVYEPSDDGGTPVE